MHFSLLTTQQAAEYLNVSEAFLNRDRVESARIPFIRIGSRTIRYRMEDLEAYIEAQTKINTAYTAIES